MAKLTATLLVAASLLAVTACGDQKILSSWDQEAGAFIDEGSFGNPTMNNTLIMTGQGGYVVALQNRFAAEVPTTITFAFDSSQLDAAATATLDKQVSWIRQFPELQFSVFGHTDLVGSPEYNKSLGLRRANAVVNYFASQGISRTRLHSLVSFGKTQPVVQTYDPERRNRRTVTEVSGFVQRHPSVLNGKYAEVIFREYVGTATELQVNTTTGTATETQ